jgi:hypothetical protein
MLLRLNVLCYVDMREKCGTQEQRRKENKKGKTKRILILRMTMSQFNLLHTGFSAPRLVFEPREINVRFVLTKLIKCSQR